MYARIVFNVSIFVSFGKTSTLQNINKGTTVLTRCGQVKQVCPVKKKKFNQEWWLAISFLRPKYCLNKWDNFSTKSRFSDYLPTCRWCNIEFVPHWLRWKKVYTFCKQNLSVQKQNKTKQLLKSQPLLHLLKLINLRTFWFKRRSVSHKNGYIQEIRLEVRHMTSMKVPLAIRSAKHPNVFQYFRKTFG